MKTRQSSDSLTVLLARAVDPSKLALNGYLTTPPSFGVYDLGSSARSTKRFRYGNHPVRCRELEAEFGSCKIEAVFRVRSDAKRVADYLNAP